MVIEIKRLREKKCLIKRLLKFNDYNNCLLNNEVILKLQQRFKSEARNIYTKEINKIALRSNDDKKLPNYIISLCCQCWKHMQNRDHPYHPDHPYRIFIIGGSGSVKTNALLKLINDQPDNDKIYLHAKDPYKIKHQYLINKSEKLDLKHYDDPKAFIEYSNDMEDVYKNIGEYNFGKKRKVSVVFDDMIADIINNRYPIVIELFIRDRKLNISIVFITQSYFKVPKDVRLNSTLFFIMKIPNKGELQQIALNQSSDIDPSFLVNDTTLPSDNPIKFIKKKIKNKCTI